MGSPRGSGGVRVGQQRWPHEDVRRPWFRTLAPGLGYCRLSKALSRARRKDGEEKPWRSCLRGRAVQASGFLRRPTPMWRVPMPRRRVLRLLGEPSRPALTRCSSAQREGTPRWRTATAAPWSTRGQNISGHYMCIGIYALDGLPSVGKLLPVTAECISYVRGPRLLVRPAGVRDVRRLSFLGQASCPCFSLAAGAEVSRGGDRRRHRSVPCPIRSAASTRRRRMRVPAPSRNEMLIRERPW